MAPTATTALTYLVTGASSGIGLELVRQLSSRGNRVFATVRSRVGTASGRDELSSVAEACEGADGGGGTVTVIEGVDISKDGVIDRLRSCEELRGGTIDVLVLNAGGVNAISGAKGMESLGGQSLAGVDSATMMDTYNLNCVGSLRVYRALAPQMRSPGGKVCIISTGMGSIGDNGSGGLYAYRCSKAAVNMMAKGMSVDLRDAGIAVVAANPGMVVTNFVKPELAEKMGGMSATVSCAGLIKIFDDLNIENTGKFMGVSRNKSPQEYAGGW